MTPSILKTILLWILLSFLLVVVHPHGQHKKNYFETSPHLIEEVTLQPTKNMKTHLFKNFDELG